MCVRVSVLRLTSPSDPARYTLEECGSHSGEVSIRAQSFPDFLQGILRICNFFCLTWYLAVSSVASNRPQTSNAFKLKTTNMTTPGAQTMKSPSGVELMKANVDTRYRVQLPPSLSGNGVEASPSDVYLKQFSSAEAGVSPAYI